MRKIIALVSLLALLLLIPSCSGNETTFTAKILEITGNIVLVEPLPDEDILRSSDKITFGTENLENIDAAVGDIVIVTYDGMVMETYPAQIVAEKWRKI